METLEEVTQLRMRVKEVQEVIVPLRVDLLSLVAQEEEVTPTYPQTVQEEVQYTEEVQEVVVEV